VQGDLPSLVHLRNSAATQAVNSCLAAILPSANLRNYERQAAVVRGFIQYLTAAHFRDGCCQRKIESS
jgi:hypothetical protein